MTVTAGAPGVASLRTTSAVVTGTSAETITVDVQPAPGATITNVTLNYRKGTTGGYTGVTMTAGTPTASGTPYTAQIPASALTDGSFIQYYATATDNQNRTTDHGRAQLPRRSPAASEDRTHPAHGHRRRRRQPVLRARPSPPAAVPDQRRRHVAARTPVGLRDDPGRRRARAVLRHLARTHGRQHAPLRRGDQIQITAATVTEPDGETRLTGVTLTKTGTTTPYGYKVLSTTDICDRVHRARPTRACWCASTTSP